MASLHSPGRVVLVDIDPDLGAAVPLEDQEEARRRSVAKVIDFDGARWDPANIVGAAGPGWVALFVVEGLLVRRVTVAGRTSCEVLGVGDVFRPWDEDGEYEPLVITVDWVVLEPGRIAVLDRDFALRMAPWPSLAAGLAQRFASRARRLVVREAVTHLPRTHARLLLLFWLLAERWGRVTPDGVVIELPLTHRILAMLVGSRRPSVTLALQKLARADLLIRRSNHQWLLSNGALSALQDPSRLSLIGGDSSTNGSDEILDISELMNP